MQVLLLTAGLVLGQGPEHPAPLRVSPFAQELQFSGRVDRTSAAGPRFAWPGTRFELRFTGTSVRVRLRDLPKTPDTRGRTWPNRFQVTLDDEPPRQVFARMDSDVLFEQDGLPDGPHRLEVYKQTEALVGASQLLGLELSPGAQLLAPEPLPSRRIEFYGDSVTTGYGNEGTDKLCPFSSETQNHWLSYGALTARALEAEAVTVAWSGRGVIRNHEAPPGAPVVPALFDRTLPDWPRRRWDFSLWTPAVVVVNLGANDFAGGDPGEEAFVAGLEAFLAQLRETYPDAFLVLCLGPTINDSWPVGAESRTRARRYLGTALLHRLESGDTRLSFLEFTPRTFEEGFGCDYHPSLVTHRAMAELLTARLRTLLGW